MLLNPCNKSLLLRDKSQKGQLGISAGAGYLFCMEQPSRAPVTPRREDTPRAGQGIQGLLCCGTGLAEEERQGFVMERKECGSTKFHLEMPSPQSQPSSLGFQIKFCQNLWSVLWVESLETRTCAEEQGKACLRLCLQKNRALLPWRRMV